MTEETKGLTEHKDHKEVLTHVYEQRLALVGLEEWVKEHPDLVDEISKTCRTYWSPFGIVAFPYTDVSELVGKLKLEGEEITTTIDGMELTIHHR